MKYLAYHFEVNPPQPGSEILCAVIAEMGFESFDQQENGFTAYIKEEENVNVNLNEVQFDDFTYTYKIETIEQENWNQSWEQNFEPVYVDDLLLIRAPFHAPDPKVKQEIVIMPKMSFGTGHHQTTRLMCRQIFETNLKGKRVLDMGCGTAILAILATKLGTKEVLGIDIDEWSVENAIENCADNGCSAIRILKGDVDLLKKESPFDCIIANINKNILKSHMAQYAASLKTGGEIFLSGFFSTDADELKQVASQYGLQFKSMKTENEWAMLVLVKS